MPHKTMPATLKRSSPKAQRTYAKTMQNAEREYGPGERAGKVTFAALKQGFEKVGDHWVQKEKRGPSDSRSQQSSADKRRGKGETYGGVDAIGNSRAELYARAGELGIVGRSKMTKEQLAAAIGRKQN